MKSQANIVVIGGGIAGCSTLYHLGVEGCRDIVLLERDTLTSGTTWHSAAQVTSFGTNQTMLGLKSHSIKLYRELARDPSYPVSYNYADGGIRLASKQDHLDGYHHFVSLAKGMGIDLEVIDPDECKRRNPLISKEGLVGGLWDPHDGHIDPAQLCQALAYRARKNGAEIYQKTEVIGLVQKKDDSWLVETNNGTIHCQTIVNASGYRVNEVASLMGVHHPVISMEHQYLVTESIPEIETAGKRIPLLRCPTDDFYCRQEKQGLLVGFYEQECKPWGLDGIDPTFTNDLCPDDLDRITDVFENAVGRLPVLENAGIHTIVNGPITYSADGLPLVGPVPGLRNAFCIVGLRAGLGEGGGHGWLLAQQIVHGEACYDTWSLDPRRFDPHADIEFTTKKAIEDYQNEFRFHMPHEYRPAGRKRRLTQLTEHLDSLGAVLAPLNGWERSMVYASNADFEITPSFAKTDLNGLVRDEVLHLNKNIGIAEVNGFNRIEISGKGVHQWLDLLSCSKIPDEHGRIGLCYFLNHHGMVKSEATLVNMGDRFWYGSAAASEVHDWDWLSAHLPNDGSIQLTSLSEEYQIILLAGPKAPELLRNILYPEVFASPLQWGHVREVSVDGVGIYLFNLSYSGELAFELHIPSEKLLDIWKYIMKAGEPLRIKPFGSLAIESMRLEKGYKHWKADLLTEFDPYESGLGMFVRNKENFLGRDALLQRTREGKGNSSVLLNVDSQKASAHPGSTIYGNGKVVGTVTSGDFGYRTNTNLAMGFVRLAENEVANVTFEIDLHDQRTKAELLSKPPFDPDNVLRKQSTLR
ncbi:MAG: FAD-dependent oxidoreductase [Rhodobacteraceae bacterium]|nr:FAD-dependent oxidoreductase [Paracoccaceae bacterium]